MNRNAKTQQRFLKRRDEIRERVSGGREFKNTHWRSYPLNKRVKEKTV